MRGARAARIEVRVGVAPPEARRERAGLRRMRAGGGVPARDGERGGDGKGMLPLPGPAPVLEEEYDVGEEPYAAEFAVFLYDAVEEEEPGVRDGGGALYVYIDAVACAASRAAASSRCARHRAASSATVRCACAWT